MGRAGACTLLSMLLLAYCCATISARQLATQNAGLSSISKAHAGRNLLADFVECTTKQKAASAVACNISVDTGTHYFICLTGQEAGGCRAQEQGSFDGSTCSSTCVIF